MLTLLLFSLVQNDPFQKHNNKSTTNQITGNSFPSPAVLL